MKVALRVAIYIFIYTYIYIYIYTHTYLISRISRMDVQNRSFYIYTIYTININICYISYLYAHIHTYIHISRNNIALTQIPVSCS